MRGPTFTERVLAELAPHTPPLHCCRGALIEGMRLGGEGGAVVTTRRVAARAALAALHAEGIPASVERLATARRHRYRVAAEPGASSANLCCSRSRLRGLFLASGSIGRADGPPQLELLVDGETAAARAIAELARLGVEAALAVRRGRPVVIVRSAAGVAVALSSMGAHRGRLEFEEGRVVRDLRAGVNRRLNAETANLRRSLVAAVRQLEAVDRLRGDRERWDGLPAALREAAELRRRRPRATLDDLATAAGCSRSAMAGRLHRLVAAGGADEVGAEGGTQPGASPGGGRGDRGRRRPAG
jgi:DNA-binding transcriptional regulator WhiA